MGAQAASSEHLPPFLIAIDLATISTNSQIADAKEIAYAGDLYAVVAPETLDNAFTILKDTAGRRRVYLQVSRIESQDDVVDLLDAGAHKVFVNGEQLSKLRQLPNIESTRLIVEESASFAAAERLTENQVVEAITNGTVPIIPANRLTTSDAVSDNHIRVAKVLLANIKSDRSDGLLSTLVTDERGIALGLVYSDGESVAESIRSGRGVYHSRKRGLWRKGDTSGDWQELLHITFDCDQDCLQFVCRQMGKGFCHLQTATCYGPYRGLSRLQKTLKSRKDSAPQGSYTAKLFHNSKMLNAKIMEEAQELCDAESKEDIAAEAADLLYFALTKATAAGVTLDDIERDLDRKSVKVKRRKGDAKGPYAVKYGVNGSAKREEDKVVKEAESKPKTKDDPAGLNSEGRIQMRCLDTSTKSPATIQEVLKRPSQRSTERIMGIVNPIVKDVRDRGDKALLEYTHKFEKATSLMSPVLKAPYPQNLMELAPETIEAIDISFENIRKFHAAQKETKILEVETMPGVVCSRFARPIERVGLYVPGGTAVLPSTALMLGVPAMVAGCRTIVLASPPRSDGSLTPEIVYVAHKIGAESIVLAGGAQAVAAMAYGTESVSKVDKILGPGNQFVTAAKMIVSNDTTANVSIDMPAGPSEVLVVADKTAKPAFVASDLLSQAEHGVDSQVICITVDLSENQVRAIEDELHKQAMALPRVDMVRGAIEHSVTLMTKTIEDAMAISNLYAPEHLILQIADPLAAREMVQNAGSVFCGQWTPESVGDYSAGVNHSLPTYGYARQYSGVNLGSYVKHITSSNLTAQGLRNVGGAVMQLAKVEELEAHRRAVEIRLEHMDATSNQ